MPSETSRVTSVIIRVRLLATGFWLMMVPSGWALFTRATRGISCTSIRRARPSSTFMPITLGTSRPRSTCSRLTLTVMTESPSTVAPAAGLVETTVPGATVLSSTGLVMTTSPASVRVCTASARE